MSLQSFDLALRRAVGADHQWLQSHFNSTVVFWYGPLLPGLLSYFRDFIEEELAKCPKAGQRQLVMVLNTPGGVAEVVEKMVEIIRAHFDHVTFVVPAYAMSAGTILCMSGDKIMMDYSSSLGPVDPQVQDNEKKLIPAMGYLDEVENMVTKSTSGDLSGAELMMLQRLDLGRLNAYKSAKELTITLLKDWLVRFKFKTWTEHRSDPDKKGQPVTEDEKLERASEIASLLANNKHWKSHGRYISMNTLKNVIRLEIDDFGNDSNLRDHLRAYHDTLVEMITRAELPVFLHGVTTWTTN